MIGNINSLRDVREEKEDNIKIKVVGVGGGGNNAVLHMLHERVRNVEMYFINTEISVFRDTKIRNVIQIGQTTTRGLGSGANEIVGERAALESKEEIQKALYGADMVFVTAGMGGGTGTGAAPIVAQLARDMGILTVGIVTKPFLFEGKKRAMRAETGIKRLYDAVDALIVIKNENLLKATTEKTSLLDAFKLADDVLKQGVQSVTDLITTVGEINVDYADVKTIFENKGKAYMGIGRATGEQRLNEAVKKAISNPLTENKIDGAKGVIFNVKGGNTLGLIEISNAINQVSDRIDPEANVLFGTVLDNSLGDMVEVTVIATGVEEEQSK